MSDAYWSRVEELFHRARELPPRSRAEKLRAWCGGDRALESEVLSLLQSDSEVEELMAGEVGSAALLVRPDGADPWIGQTLGRYVLERLLGRGGMGAVYLARRNTGDLTQTVAIKVIARHLSGAAALPRFLAERSALARMEHRYVARLIDGGLQGETPYVVMEYVDGRRLDEYVDAPGVSLRTKLQLFLQLCEAVAHVHSHLIVHRDLKPGNVLVTREGNVKLLDFGALKRLDVEAADSLLTRMGMRPLTLHYASPEQIRGAPVSTAADIYSLGVILYRMMSGGVPHQDTGKGLSEYLRQLEFEPPAPAGQSSDLDAVIAKALRFDPAQRYSSVDAIALDVRNVLEDRPVAARAGRTTYRAAKFFKRHRTAAASVAVVLLSLAVGLLAIGREGRVARAEAARAEAGVETERALTHLLLFDYFEQLKQIPGSTDAQRRAVTQAVRYLDSTDRVAPEPVWLADRVAGYTRMGNLLGNPYEENINDAPRAIVTLGKAVGLAGQLLARQPNDPHALELAAEAQMALGRVYFGSGDPQHAAQYLVPAAAISERLANIPGIDSATLAQAASIVDSLGDVDGQDGAVTLDDPVKAGDAYRRAQVLDSRGLRLDATCARCRRGVALEYWKLGILEEALDNAEAVALYQRGLETLRPFSAEEQSSARVLRIDTVLRQRLGAGLIATGQAQQGMAMLRAVHERFAAALRADPLDARARFDLAALDPTMADGYEALGQHAEMQAADREYLDNINALVTQDPASSTWRLHRADARIRYARARGLPMDEGVAELVELARSNDADSALLVMAADALVEAGRDAPLALQLAQRAAASAKTPSADVLLALAKAQRAAGQSAAGKATAQQALAILAQHPQSMGNHERRAEAQALME